MQSAVEILKTAIENEIRSEVFYTKASELTQDDESRMVFIELAGLEDNHARHLAERFKGEAAKGQLDLDAFVDEVGRRADQMLSVDETRLITEGSMAEVLEFAVGQEERARDNYRSLAAQLEDPADRAFCEALAEEEQLHAERLLQLRRSIDMDPDERPDL